MKKLALLGTLLISTFTSFAEDIDLQKSSFIWKGSKITGSYHSGPIQMKEASLDDGKGVFIADMNSIDDTTLEGKWKEKFLGHIKSSDFFDVEKYPTSKLVVEKIDNGYLYGQLTIKNKTHDVTVPLTKQGNV